LGYSSPKESCGIKEEAPIRPGFKNKSADPGESGRNWQLPGFECGNAGWQDLAVLDDCAGVPMGSIEAGKNSFHFRVALRPRRKAIDFLGGLVKVSQSQPTFRGSDVQEVIDVQQSSP
jgi:hypothetical protein